MFMLQALGELAVSLRRLSKKWQTVPPNGRCGGIELKQPSHPQRHKAALVSLLDFFHVLRAQCHVAPIFTLPIFSAACSQIFYRHDGSHV